MEIFDKIRQVLRFLVECLSPWIAMGGWDGPIQRGLITTAVFEHDVIVYVKGHEKRTWLWNLLLDDERERIYIEIFQFTKTWNL